MFRRRFLGPAVADAEIDPPAGYPVEAGELVSEQDRIAQRGEKYRRAQTDPLRARADGGQGGQRIDARPRRQTIADPHRVKAQCLGALGNFKQSGRIGASGHDRFAGG